jgi:hypothetical protein
MFWLGACRDLRRQQHELLFASAMCSVLAGAMAGHFVRWPYYFGSAHTKACDGSSTRCC